MGIRNFIGKIVHGNAFNESNFWSEVDKFGNLQQSERAFLKADAMLRDNHMNWGDVVDNMRSSKQGTAFRYDLLETMRELDSGTITERMRVVDRISEDLIDIGEDWKYVEVAHQSAQLDKKIESIPQRLDEKFAWERDNIVVSPAQSTGLLGKIKNFVRENNPWSAMRGETTEQKMEKFLESQDINRTLEKKSREKHEGYNF